jgi:tellurite resistance protein
MSESHAIVELPDVEPARRAAAIHAVATEYGGRAARLHEGARASVADAPGDVATARAFQTTLELGYLVASADGFAKDERETLSRLLESITGAAVDHATLTLHFLDLDEAVEALGRRERLARLAAELDGTAAAEEAVSLAALIAMADGRLSDRELEVLVELGGHVSLGAERVRAIVDDMAGRVEAQLR